ncbi:nucleoid-associated protein [Flavobacterium sp. MC2016-06]|jgi:nucleoid-associated protein|uniref:nucleoid-associated protein n=1 Tax=Flavobacterium sp. MC2016-06 TaxID=2676308 RepID=UPI0012BA816C|nr:nucleoid-associated protein [Flavobacterium sp. MC2016-06]MBU3859088.1 nucleoid-associated protein [Flavobacterium sp. MC2016-06]
MQDKITVNRYVIHFLDKQKNKTTATIDYSQKVSQTDDFSKILAESLHKSITESSSLKNTKFKENNTNDFSTFLNNYLELSDDADDQSFLDFSKSLDKLREEVETKPFATGGYYLFIDYASDSSRYISVVLLRKKGGLNVIKKDGVYTLDNTENINIDKIAMAFRLNFSIYLNLESEVDKNNYLALITTQQDGEISEYFRDWVNAGDMIKNSENTKNFLRIIKNIDMPKNDSGEDCFKSLDEFKRAIFDHIKDRKSKTINLLDISRNFYGEGNENKIAETARDYGIDIDNEFKKDARIVRELITIKASVDGIILSVDYDKINPDEVEIKDEYILIKNKKLANKLTIRYNAANSK